MGLQNSRLFFFSLILSLAFSFPLLTALADVQEDFDLAVAAWDDNENAKAIELFTTLIGSGELDEGQLLMAIYGRGDAAYELDLYEQAIEDFSSTLEYEILNDFLLGVAYYQRAWSYWNLDLNDQALADMGRAIDFYDPTDRAIYYRAIMAYILDKYDVFMQDVVLLGWEYPERLENLDTQYVYKTIRWAKEEGFKKELFEFLSALKKADYNGPYLEETPEFLLIELAFLNMERAEHNKALVQIHQVESRLGLIEVLLDRRFEPLWEKAVFKSKTTLEGYVENDLTRTREAMEADPKNLQKFKEYSDALVGAGKSKKALKLLQWALKNLDSFELENDEEIDWLKNDLAYAYLSSNQNQKAFEVFDEILEVSLDEKGDLVSQYINYSISLLNHSEFQKALTILEDIDVKHASGFGELFILMGRACSLNELGKSAEANLIGDEIMLRWKENSGASQMALLCLERYEDAKKLILERLENENERSLVLMALQNFITPEDVAPYTLILQARFQTLKDDSEVKTTLLKYGRILEAPLPEPFYGEY